MARRVEKEETLDPENWATMRALGYKMLDDVLDSLENIRSSPVWEPMAEDVFRKICEPLPREPQGPEKVYKDFCELREMNRGTGSIHPRFWGWVMGTGNVMSGYADIKSTMIYINLEQALFNIANDEFHVKTAKTVEEACKLAEVGFEHFDTINDVHLYRKRK